MDHGTKTKMLAEGGVMIGLAVILGYITIYQAPNGGSVSAGGMIPLLLFAIRWGVGPGIAVGSIYGVLDFILKPYFYHWAQFFLDYPIAYGLLGLAGIAYVFKGNSEYKGYFKLIMGVILAIFGRMISHVLSGVIFFSDAAGSQNPWIYSIVYNSTYLIPELIISILVLVLIWKPLQKTISS